MNRFTTIIILLFFHHFGLFSQVYSYSGITNIIDTAVYSGKSLKEDFSFNLDSVRVHAMFDNVTFDGYTSFNRTVFEKGATFYSTTFNRAAGYIDATFNSYANFSQCNFNSHALFINSSFNGPAYFNLATFTEKADFLFASFDSIVDFTGTKFRNNGMIDLSKAAFQNDNVCLIRLYRTDLSRFKLRYGSFRLDTSGIERGELEALYLDLRSRLIELNYIEDAETLDKEYQEWKYLFKDPNNKHWIVNAFHKYWWGYSYDKYRIAYNTFYIFIFFLLVNLFAMPKMCKEVYIVTLVSEDLLNRNENLFYTILRRLFQSAFYTGIIFFGIYFKTENFVRIKNGKSIFGRKFFGIIYFFIMYGLGLFCLGYLANFILSK